MLDWRTICPSNDPRHLVKGTELEYCFPDGFLHRFKIVSVRILALEAWTDADRALAATGAIVPRRYYHDCKYRVYDAATISDAEIKAGVAPRSVDFTTLDAALAAIEPHRYKEPEE